jgi:hypothetical protein
MVRDWRRIDLGKGGIGHDLDFLMWMFLLFLFLSGMGTGFVLEDGLGNVS